jgi:hypothetical protein
MSEDGYPPILISQLELRLTSRPANSPQSPGKQIQRESEAYPPRPLSASETRQLRLIGKAMLGPLLNLFYKRLFRTIEALTDRPKTLYFIAREGYFLQRGYNAVQSLANFSSPNSQYLFASRVLLFRLLLHDEKMAEDICGPNFAGSLGDFLSARCGLTQQEYSTLEVCPQDFPNGLDSRVTMPLDHNILINFLRRNQEHIKELTKDSTIAYKRYLQDLEIRPCKSCFHIVDVGYSGTIQKCLSHFTSQNTFGHYIVTTKNATSNRADSYMGHVFQGVDWSSGCSILDNSLLIESILTSPQGSARDIKLVGDAISFKYGAETPAQKYFFVLEEIFNGCIEYCLENFSNTPDLMASEINIIFDNLIKSNPISQVTWLAKILSLDDSFSGRGISFATSITHG